MEIAAHLDALETDGLRLAEVAGVAGLDGVVSTCPGWRIRDLVKHLGYVHRWAARHVAEARPTLAPTDGEAVVLTGGPSDDLLLDWFTEGHADLVTTLRSADPALSCWAFLPAPSPLAFWARRQAHETAVHLADAQSALGTVPSFDPSFAADGLDELVMGFAPTERARVTADRRRVLSIEPEDTADRWLVGLGPEGIDSVRGSGAHQAALRGRASDLYLVLWNRLRPDGSAITLLGESELVALWRDSLQVRWSS